MTNIKVLCLPAALHCTCVRVISFRNIRRKRTSGQYLYKRTVPTTRQASTSARPLSNTPAVDTRRSHGYSVMAFPARRTVWRRWPSGSRVACRQCRCLPYRHCEACCTTDVDIARTLRPRWSVAARYGGGRNKRRENFEKSLQGRARCRCPSPEGV